MSLYTAKRMSSTDIEEARLAALASYDILDTPAEDVFDEFPELAARGLGVPFAAISLLDRQRAWFKAATGLESREIRRSESFCSVAIQATGVFIVPDAADDERFCGGALVTQPPHIRFYAGTPLVTTDGYRLGTLCVLSPDPCLEFGPSKRDFLQRLARLIMMELGRRRQLRQQVMLSADLAFWNRLDGAIAAAADFDGALAQALAHCADRTGAAICFLAKADRPSQSVGYLKSHFQPSNAIAAFDIGRWFGMHPADSLSFGVAVLQGEDIDSGPLEDPGTVAGFRQLQELMQVGIRRQITHPFDLANQRFALVLAFDHPDPDPNVLALIREFTTRLTPLLLGRLREDALEHANRALRTIHACTAAFADTETADALFEAACHLAVQSGGYGGCWIGLMQHDDEKSIKPVASAGRSVPALEDVRMRWGDEPHGWGPAGTAIRERRITVSTDLAHDPLFAPWHDLALGAGFRTCLSLPIILQNTDTIGVLTLYSNDPTSFGEEEQRLLSDLVTILAKALQTVFAREERDAALNAQSTSERRTDRLLAASSVVLYALAPRGEEFIPIEVSHNISKVLGYEPEEACKSGWWLDHVHPADRRNASQAIARVLEAGQHTHRYRFKHRAGGYRWLRDEMTLQRDVHGIPSGVVGVWLDVTDSHIAEEKIYRLANIDPLTELPNRRLLQERLQESLVRARGADSYGALLFVDIDRFKIINDVLGHSSGDKVLKEIAQKLTSCIRAYTGDTVARIGGDEFVVLLPEIVASQSEASVRVASIGWTLFDTIAEQPFVIEKQEFHLRPSIGFTLFPKRDDTLDSLIREADTAMYQAKSGETNVVMFEPAMYLSLLAKHEVEDEIRHAVKAGRFELWLQDQFSVTGQSIGAEALIRLKGRDGRMIQPCEFIGIAESSGLIVPLGRWILTEACTILARMLGDRPDWRLSVNVSPKQFRHPGFVADVTAALERNEIPPDHLTLEITENLLIDDVVETTKVMKRLSGLGVRFAIDDFGTGYSNLHYLQRLPINEIKIDKSFIGQLPGDKSASVITEAILGLARSFELDVVAEGVETFEHFAFLRDRGCTMMQGYLFSRPVATAEWLARSCETPRAGNSFKRNARSLCSNGRQDCHV